VFLQFRYFGGAYAGNSVCHVLAVALATGLAEGLAVVLAA